jgi:hypothetical protein
LAGRVWTRMEEISPISLTSEKSKTISGTQPNSQAHLPEQDRANSGPRHVSCHVSVPVNDWHLLIT